MAVGLEITDDAGRKQVIDTAPMLVFTETVYAHHTLSDGRRCFTGNNLLVLKPNNSSIVLWDLFRTGNTTVASEGDAWLAFSLKGDGTVYKFEYNLAPESTENFGLEIYNESGVIQFTSHQKPLKILDVFETDDLRTLNSNYRTNGAILWSKDYSGKTVGMILSEGAFYTDNDEYFMSIGAQKIGDTINLVAADMYKDKESVRRGGGIVPNYKAKVFLIDLTNY